MRILLLIHITLLISLAGCASDNTDKTKILGADKDEFGCVGSAGYSWCARTKQCERPWELAKKAGFENTSESFENYCKITN